MRKICFVITSKIHYGRSKLLLQALQKHKKIDLQIVVGGSAVLETYGNVIPELERDGFTVDAKIIMSLAGGSSVAMAKTTGIGIAEFATAFDNLQPDIVLVRGDRYEVLSAAVAAAYLNIPLAHIEGGDVTGTIDESVRHAITKLAHIHFPTNDVAKERILRMGENPEYIHNVGCPAVEYLSHHKTTISNELINEVGVGDVIDLEHPYAIVMQHPVTTEMQNNKEHTEVTLQAMYELDIPTIWFWPNVDAGTDDVSKAIRVFRENYDPANMRFVKYLPVDKFIALLKGARCLVGNSSAGIKEASYFGVPVVNIGSRQQGRMRGEHVIDVAHDSTEIKDAVAKQLAHGMYQESDIYYKKNTAKNIVDILANTDLYTQKKFYDK